MGAGAGPCNDPLKQVPGAGSQAFFRGSRSRELGVREKRYRSKTLAIMNDIYMIQQICFYQDHICVIEPFKIVSDYFI